ncbi:SDR family NAD(P)-dependent oxidoreductase [Cyanobium sp. ATX-6F1]|uniref:SDR family NAD(P)-dependent oxidoreductase n=1 Tax=Cyanobium sp. ATX-6F1 TaxID=3137388 RepID=UPI0039BDFAB2
MSDAGATRHILLTGGSSGIGLEAAVLLLQAGHRLTLPCRNAAAATGLRQRLGGQLQTPVCDLADLSSLERCAESLLAAGEPIDTLVLNAGLQYSGGAEPRWSAQGFELTIAVNHLAHQALLQRLLPLLLRGTAPRLVVTASEVHDPSSAGGRWAQRPAWAIWLGCARGLGRRCWMAAPASMPRRPTKTASFATC